MHFEPVFTLFLFSVKAPQNAEVEVASSPSKTPQAVAFAVFCEVIYRKRRVTDLTDSEHGNA